MQESEGERESPLLGWFTKRLWQDLKGRIAGQVFKSLQALKDRVAELLRRYLKEEIRSLTGYAYIVEAVNGLVL